MPRSLLHAPAAGLAAALTLILALGAAGPAAAQARLVNPCGFAETDTPCEVSDGVYRALVPQTAGPHPAFVYLYGSLGRSRQITEDPVFRDSVVRRGYALIVPAALDVVYANGERGTGWGRRGRVDHPRDDIAFLDRVLTDAADRFGIDRDRVILAGHSDGGFLIYQIACEGPRLATVYAVHGASYGAPPRPLCAEPVRFLHSHGRNDEVVPLSGELTDGPWVLSADVSDALAMLARTDGCDPDPRLDPRGFGFERWHWRDCAEGAALDLLLHDGGHDWPEAWIGAVLDWTDEVTDRPAEPVRRRVPDGETELPPPSTAPDADDVEREGLGDDGTRRGPGDSLFRKPPRK